MRLCGCWPSPATVSYYEPSSGRRPQGSASACPQEVGKARSCFSLEHPILLRGHLEPGVSVFSSVVGSHQSTPEAGSLTGRSRNQGCPYSQRLGLLAWTTFGSDYRSKGWYYWQNWGTGNGQWCGSAPKPPAFMFALNACIFKMPRTQGTLTLSHSHLLAAKPSPAIN